MSVAPARQDNFPLFDSLRAIGLLMVMGHHGFLQAGQHDPKAAELLYPTGLDRYMLHWEAGVTIFFLISGFLLYRPFAKARFHGRQVPSLRNYSVRRLSRIIPAYWVALTVLTIAVGLEGVFTAEGIPTYYLFLQIYDGSTAIGGIGQAWTLGVELAYYVFLPVWVIWMATRPPAASPHAWLRRELGGLGALVVFGIAWNLAMLGFVVDYARPDKSALPYLMPLPAYIDQVALGMAFAVLSVWVVEQRGGNLWPRLRWISEKPGRAWWIAAALWFVLTNFLPGPRRWLGVVPSDPEYMIGHVFNGVIAAAIMAPFVFGDQSRGLLRRAMRFRPLAYMGVVAYGIYLYHLVIFQQLLEHEVIPISGWFTYFAYWLLGAGLSVAAAATSWHLMEEPIMRWAKRLERRRPPSAPPAPQPASGFAG